MNKEEQNEINRYLTEEVLGEHFCKPMLRSPERCSCGSFMVDTPPVSLSNPNAFTDDGNSWEFVQRVLDKSQGNESVMMRLTPLISSTDNTYRLLTMKPAEVAQAIYKTLKENSDV